MKRITLLFAFIGMITMQSCTGPEGAPGTPGQDGLLSEVLEYNVSFTTANNFSNLISFPHTIYSSDMVLVYRLSGSTSQGTDIWKLLPETYYTNTGAFDFRYDFDFTKVDVNIYMDGFDLATVNNSYRINQILRVVILPGYFGNKNANSASIDFNNYNAVAAAYHIDESKIIKIK